MMTSLYSSRGVGLLAMLVGAISSISAVVGIDKLPRMQANKVPMKMMMVLLTVLLLAIILVIKFYCK